MRHAYKTINFRNETLLVIHIAERIIQDIQADGHTLSIRQLFYQFIAKDLFPPTWVDPAYNLRKGLDPDTKNTEKNYKRLANIINDARFAGHIEWTAIEDRTRNLRSLAHWESPADIVKTAVEQFRMDKWVGQEYRVEVWVEKDALINIVEKVCQPLDIPCFACRGYVSSSELWSAAQRLLDWEDEGYKTVVLHLGDHDPSGVDMTRDIEEKLELFYCETEVKRIALTMSQVRTLKPPPNPTKPTDSRSKEYVPRYGHESWELDALPPKYLSGLVKMEVENLRQAKPLKKVLSKEKKAKALLNKEVKKLLKDFEKGKKK